MISSILFLAVGGIFLLKSFQINGMAILGDANTIYSSVAGIWLIAIGGLLLILAERERRQKLELALYDSSGGRDKDHDRAYVMDDPKMELGGGPVRLGEFKKIVAQYKSEKDGEELVEILREAYGRELREKTERGDEEEARIARSFLEVLGEKVEPKREEYKLRADERREFINTFKSYDGRVTSPQRKLLEKYELIVIHDKGARHHYKVEDPHTGLTHPLSMSPSDHHAAQNLAHQLVEMIEKSRNMKK